MGLDLEANVSRGDRRAMEVLRTSAGVVMSENLRMGGEGRGEEELPEGQCV